MAIGTVGRITARVVVVALLLFAASIPAVAAFDGQSATPDHQSLATDEPAWRATDGVLHSSFEPVQRITATVGVDSAQIGIDERLEHVVQYGVQHLHEFDGLLPSLVALGYRRHDGSDPLANERRADVFETITESPGIYVSKLSDETPIHRSTVRHHVRVLEAEGLILEKTLHGKHRLYPVETTDMSLIAALDDEATAAVLQALSRVEPASVSLLADDLDRAPSTVSHHLSRLAEDGLVVREREGNAVLTRLPPHVREALQSVESAIDSKGDSTNARAD